MPSPQIQPSFEEFQQLAAHHGVVPVWTELVADAETPITAFAKISGDGPAFLFESAEQDEKGGRYSILGAGAEREFVAHGCKYEVRRNGQVVRSGDAADPLKELEREMSGLLAPSEVLHFPGGCIGYLSYDAIRYFEPTVPAPPKDELGLPDMYFFTTDRIIVFDHLERRLKVTANAYPSGSDLRTVYDSACEKVRTLLAQLARPAALKAASPSAQPTSAPVVSNTKQSDFLRMVERAKEYIRAGDVFQVVLSQRFETPCDVAPLELYRALRFVNPSPYMFLIRCPGYHLVGSSPEVHVRVDSGQIQIRPIAGTIRRGTTPEEDQSNADKLLSDPKERAEHLMLVDLARNDVGRIAQYDTVRVTDFMTIERYSHVMHIVSNVVGKLSRGHSIYDVMRATFPAGTVSGAPKVRAMQIINELEQSKRCSYSGAVGYFGYDGNLNSCIALRTVLLKDGKAYVQAGAGVVADSTPQGEHQETINKAMGVIRAIERARTIEQS